ncbi:TolC family protein [uncultured Paludibaculum sp.]|uniref:TolC family protein n=1 Tax=uncultured Paludibaculum sp. TaxID=1765020 RepID=UPI002AABF557|nr:TolC family protein [uncultured Paludibaculum sp.]
MGVPVDAQGQTERVLTLDDALAMAEEHNPQLKAAAAMARGAQASIRTASAYPNPEFTTFAGRQYRRLPGAEPGLLQHYSVEQQVELPSVRKSRIQAAELGRQSSRFGLDEARLGVRAGVKRAFYLVLRRKAELALAKENLRLVEDLRRRIEIQVEVGEAAKLELVRSDAEAATAKVLANSAQLRLLNATAGLRTAIGAPMAAEIAPRGDLEKPIALPPWQTLLGVVLQEHPMLALARSEIERAKARLAHETALRKPQPALRAEYENQPDLGFFRFGVTLPLPVWNRREGPIAEAEAAVEQLRAAADMRQLELTSALEQAYGQYQVASQQVASFELGVLKEATAAVNAAEAAFKFGERGIIEVLDAQRVLRTVRQDFLTAQYDVQDALINLEQLRAITPEKH